MVNLYFKVKMNPLNKNKRHKRKEGRAGRNRILRNSGATKLWIACWEWEGIKLKLFFWGGRVEVAITNVMKWWEVRIEDPWCIPLCLVSGGFILISFINFYFLGYIS